MDKVILANTLLREILEVRIQVIDRNGLLTLLINHDSRTWWRSLKVRNSERGLKLAIQKAIQLEKESGSLSGSLGVTQSGQGIQPQPDTSDLWFSLTAKEGYPAAILGSRSLLVVVQTLKNEGQNQEQIIRLLWGLPKNGKPKYKQAVEEYKKLLGEV